MAGDAAPTTVSWFTTTPVDHMFDLDDALTLPAADLPPARSVEEIELQTATDADVKDMVCSICTEGFKFKPGRRDGKRVPCGHVYHWDCISTWLSRFNSCPLCRAQVLLT